MRAFHTIILRNLMNLLGFMKNNSSLRRGGAQRPCFLRQTAKSSSVFGFVAG